MDPLTVAGVTGIAVLLVSWMLRLAFRMGRNSERIDQGVAAFERDTRINDAADMAETVDDRAEARWLR